LDKFLAAGAEIARFAMTVDDKIQLSEPVEFLSGRLCWTTHLVGPPPKDTPKLHYFTVEGEFQYEPFFADFGPLNLALTYRYCRLVDKKMNDPVLRMKRIIHYVSSDPKERANAAYLIGAYMVIAHRQTAEAAFAPLRGVSQPFINFRDASQNSHTQFQLTILDCLRGLEMAIKAGLFDWEKFDVDTYEFFEKVENGDLNWVLPRKFVAFAGPSAESVDEDGYPAFTPEDYVPIFLDAGVHLVVRLNRKQYDRQRFTKSGVKHVDLYFPDGTCPPTDIVNKFLHITAAEPGPVAVHCKAGLGRTGTLIGLYAMKHHRFCARDFIGWIRICRPGSVIGPQQQYLIDNEAAMFQAGELLKRPMAWPSSPTKQEEDKLATKLQGLTLRTSAPGLSPTGGTRPLTAAEAKEDVGQGESLFRARRQYMAPAVETGQLSHQRWR
jgi:cell division cycle 14